MKHQPKAKKTCQYCKKIFTIYAYLARNKPCKFCSRFCYFEHKRINRHVQTQCHQCGTTMVVEQNVMRKSKYGPFCSRKCYGHWRSINMTGDRCSWWRGGKNFYYLGSWKKTRQAAKQRDNFTCQHCGKQSPPKSRQLDVHHIKSYKEFTDHNKAHELENLITLCRDCHNKLHSISRQLPT